MKKLEFHIGLRTIKTTAAVIIAMLLVDYLGTSSSKLVFAMLGAMAAVQPTFKESVESCLTQIVGVLLGALAGVLLQTLPIPRLFCVGIGLVLVITIYNVLQICFSPSLPCFVVVMICTTPDVQPIIYAVERSWDTAIGLGVGMLINMLVFPYDNSRQIRALIESLDEELLSFLEHMFDGDDDLPDAGRMTKIIEDMDHQLKTFSNQKLWLRLRRQKEELEKFRICERKGREMIARMEVLHNVDRPGALTEENRKLLMECGASIKDTRVADLSDEKDVVTNYHVRQILMIRNEWIAVLCGQQKVTIDQ